MVNRTEQTTPQGVAGSDRVLPETHWSALILLVIVISAFLGLFLTPDNVGQFFAWHVKPAMTALMMSAGYICGAWFFFRAFRATQWHKIVLGFLPVFSFATFIGIATFLNWYEFDRDQIFWYPWLIVYAILPFWIAILWYRNRGADPGTPDPDDVMLPGTVRQAMVVVGGLLMLCAGIMLLFAHTIATAHTPDANFAPFGQDLWAWPTSMLTVQVMASWVSLPGAVGLLALREARWSAWRVILECLMIQMGFILIGVLRAFGDFYPGRPLGWLYIAIVALLLLSIGGLYYSMEAQRRRVTMKAPA